MCGISACISLAPASSNGHSNGCREHANTPFDGETKSNNHVNGTAKGLATQLKASVNAISHRGPDDSDAWISDHEQVGLAHCRLSINDLSSAGRQPLHSSDNQIHAVVNGEIYDYDRLRHECETVHQYAFQSDSDSELVLALYQAYGAPDFFTHLRGEFAFVIYDNRQGSQRVIAGRDRYGIKPLVYTRLGSKLLVASEAKAFLPMGWKPRWDVRAISDAGWMFDDRTLFRGVQKVLPGHYLDITAEGGVRQVKYWDAEYEDKSKPEIRTIDEMVTGTRERLVESVRLRLRADVPVGIYLSGGIDSSAIAGIVTELARKEKVKIGNEQVSRVTCFSVGFPEASGYDESHIAERTAEWLGVKTIKKVITEDTLAGDFEDAVFHCEHHHFDLNFVAKFALSTLPREHGVKVVLTGEGADEHFAGYPYFPAEFLREADAAWPDSQLSQTSDLRYNMFKSVQREMKGIWQKGGATAYEDRPAPASIAGVGATDMSDNLLAWHPTATLFAPWLQTRLDTYDCRQTVLNSHSTDVQAKMRSRWHPLHTSMYMWNKNSLPNVLLSCLGDRTEMAHSVEARTPFLDHHLTEYVNRLPPSVKLRYSADTKSDTGELGPIWTKSSVALLSLNEKWILRQAVRPYITDELYKRKKHPFLAPTRWAKDGPLHHKFKTLLTQQAVEQLGFVNWETIQEDMEFAWGETADPKAFRRLVYCGAWVTLSQRMGIAKAEASDLEPTV
ncbi:asparagine synthase-domain-containing protein [Aspergillus bertholletiae]|uniref:Asparagine synthase-domain-containing protein n=1 Tax=Aspergillus bertholletiae TaxID=1226010 RepID=A0A5N7B3S8_9EURO|nr:asparagine synthase-domain-containing protein [Aspergillus bertholletiae]